VLFILWDLAVRTGFIKAILLPPPLDALGTLISGLWGGPLLKDFGVTVMRTVQAFLIAAAVGMPLGVLLGSNERAYRSVEFLIDFFRSTPSSALIPLFLMIFGVSDVNKVAIAAFGAFLIVVFNSAYGVINARKQRVMAAKVMGATRWQIFKDVLVWESLQPSFVGLRSAVSMALVIVIVAEMFIGADSGLGNRIINSQQVLNVRDMYASILAAGALGYALNILFLSPNARLFTGAEDERRINAPVLPTSPRAGVQARPGRHAHHHPRPDQVLRGLAAVRELRPGHPQTQDCLGVRPQRLRQEHADQHDRGADPHRQRRDPVRRQEPEGHQDRLRVPELPRSDVPVDAHHRQHRLPAQAGRQVQSRGGPPHGRAGGVVSTSSSTSTATRTSCRAASSRRRPSCGRWPTTPRCCSWTSRSLRWISR
jgi:ABC-type nitrate/sulfonate/bicarbonate transport system permease component